MTGAPADAMAAEVARDNGVSLAGHIARPFLPQIAAENDLILVMESGHKREIVAKAPQLQGKIMLFDQWTSAAGIPDPYRKPRAMHEHVFAQISCAADGWCARLQTQKAGIQ